MYWSIKSFTQMWLSHYHDSIYTLHACMHIHLNPNGRVSVILLFACHFSYLNNAIRVWVVDMFPWVGITPLTYDCQTCMLNVCRLRLCCCSLSLSRPNWILTQLFCFPYFLYLSFYRSHNKIYTQNPGVWYNDRSVNNEPPAMSATHCVIHAHTNTTHTYIYVYIRIQSNSIAYCVHACMHESLIELK